MNIFRLDEHPLIAAEYHCDKHVVKMILESAQLLHTAHGSKAWANNPLAVWVRESNHNYYWLYSLGIGLCTVYTSRYDKQHAYHDLFYTGLLRYIPASVPQCPPTPQPQCMPVEYKGEDVVEAYRRYYLGDKLRFARWRYSATPPWVLDYLKEQHDTGSLSASTSIDE